MNNSTKTAQNTRFENCSRKLTLLRKYKLSFKNDPDGYHLNQAFVSQFILVAVVSFKFRTTKIWQQSQASKWIKHWLNLRLIETELYLHPCSQVWRCKHQCNTGCKFSHNHSRSPFRLPIACTSLVLSRKYRRNQGLLYSLGWCIVRGIHLSLCHL